MKARCAWFVVCMAIFSLAGCAFLKPKKPEEKKAEGPKLVGRIASIPADKRFVLIQSYGSWNISNGTVLTTRGTENRTANLLVTGEKLGEFAAADVQAGDVEVGDGVYSRHEPKPQETSQAPSSAAESEPKPSVTKGEIKNN